MGYRVYYDYRLGKPNNKYIPPIVVGDSTTELTINDLELGRVWYFVVTAIDTAGNESLPSDVVFLRITDGVDLDGDDLPDDYEYVYWGSTTVIDGTQDTDRDGLTESMEYQQFTLPIDADTDDLGQIGHEMGHAILLFRGGGGGVLPEREGGEQAVAHGEP